MSKTALAVIGLCAALEIAVAFLPSNGANNQPAATAAVSVTAPSPMSPENCALTFGGSGALLEFSGSGAFNMCLQWEVTREGFTPAIVPPWAPAICAFDFRGLAYTVFDPGGASPSAAYLCDVLAAVPH